MDKSQVEQDLLNLHRLGWNIIRLHGVYFDSESARYVCTCGDYNCAKPGKHPVNSWSKSVDNPLSAVQIKSWVSSDQPINWAVLTGRASGISVIDIDAKSGGFESLKQMGLEFPDDWFETPMVTTGGGGAHIYVRSPNDPDFKTGVGIAPGIDIRHDGGIIVIPPSLHSSGKHYEWVPGREPWSIPIRDLDVPMFLDRARSISKKAPTGKKKPEKTSLFTKISRGISEGNRNESMTQLVGHFMGKSMPDEEVYYLAQKMNEDFFSPPLPSVELWSIISSIRRGESTNDAIDPADIKQSIVDYLQLNKTISSDKSPVTLKSITQSTGADPTYLFEFAIGLEVIEIKMTSVQLHSPQSFTRLLADQLRRVPKKLGEKSAPTHTGLVNMILSTMEVRDTGFLGTDIGEVIANVDRYIKHSAVHQVSQLSKVPDRGILEYGDSYWIGLNEYCEWANNKTATKSNPKLLSSLLTVYNIQRKSFTVEGGGRRSVWEMPKEYLRRMTQEPELEE